MAEHGLRYANCVAPVLEGAADRVAKAVRRGFDAQLVRMSAEHGGLSGIAHGSASAHAQALVAHTRPPEPITRRDQRLVEHSEGTSSCRDIQA